MCLQEKDVYGNEVQRLGRPLPVEYLLVDIPASTPVQQLYTFTTQSQKERFPIENRSISGHMQDFNSLMRYLGTRTSSELLEVIKFILLQTLLRLESFALSVEMPPTSCYGYEDNHFFFIVERLLLLPLFIGIFIFTLAHI